LASLVHAALDLHFSPHDRDVLHVGSGEFGWFLRVLVGPMGECPRGPMLGPGFGPGILLHQTLDDYVRLFQVYEPVINPDKLRVKIEEGQRRFEAKNRRIAVSKTGSTAVDLMEGEVVKVICGVQL
jgi:hypothetical protein